MIQAVVSGETAQYEQIVTDFLLHRGHILYVTPDRLFVNLLRLTLSRHLGINSDMYSTAVNLQNLFRTVLNMAERFSLLILLDRVIDGTEVNPIVSQLKKALPDTRLIVLSQETDNDKIVLLHEAGADNFITKPISVNGLIEKMAFTIRPFGKLGQLIDQARSLLKKNDPQKALGICNQVLALKPNSAAALLVSGDSFLAMNNIDMAFNSYEKARTTGIFLAPLQKLADLCARVGREEQHRRYLEELDSLSPLNTERKILLGQLYLKSGKEDRAREYFEKSVTIATREALDGVGKIATRIATIYANHPFEAEVFLRRALEIKSSCLSREDVETFNRLGLNLRRQGRWREAIAEYKRALAVDPHDENLYYNMGMAHAEGREWQQAQKHMEQVFILNPRFPERGAAFAGNMGLVFLHNNNKQKAVELLNLALKLDPAYAQAKRALKSLGEFNFKNI